MRMSGLRPAKTQLNNRAGRAALRASDLHLFIRVIKLSQRDRRLTKPTETVGRRLTAWRGDLEKNETTGFQKELVLDATTSIQDKEAAARPGLAL